MDTRLRFIADVNPAVPLHIRASRDQKLSFVPMEAIGENWSLDLSRERRVSEVLTGYSYFEDGDVVLAKVTPCFENGKAVIMQGLTQGSGFGTTEVTVVRAKSGVNAKFLFYVLVEQSFKQLGLAEMTGAGGLKRVPDRIVRDLIIKLPTRAKQDAMVAYLDRETASIQSFIAEQERLQALLAERRAALITHAVTGGIGSFDASLARLLPRDWYVLPLKRLVRGIVQGVSPQADGGLASEGSVGVLRAGCVNGGVFNELEHKRLPDGFQFDSSIRVHVGDLIVNRASGSPSLVGSAARVRALGYNLILSDKTFRLRLGESIDADYLELYLNSSAYRRQVNSAISGAEGLANNLPMSALRAIAVTVPPLFVQRQIVASIRRELAEIDSAAAEARRAVGLIMERRAALISATVAGELNPRAVV